MSIRTGIGYDVHRFAEGRVLVLGGVTIPNARGLLGHSDADVLLHAIADAVLGAAALGDIGTHFPPSDPQWAGADSSDLLGRVYALVAGAGFRVGNVDATIIAEAPRVMPHAPAMRARIAECLSLDLYGGEREGHDERRFGVHRPGGGHRRSGDSHDLRRRDRRLVGRCAFSCSGSAARR